jgi:nitric oxide dioxygenase
MNPAQKTLVRQTFAQIEPIAPLAANLFYGRLFEIDPTARALFAAEPGSAAMGRQGAKLMQTIGVAVAHLDNLDAVLPAVEALARRHVGYGVEPAHYDTVGAALLWTLDQGLAERYTPEVAEAWAALYNLLADTMRRAAYGADPVVAR